MSVNPQAASPFVALPVAETPGMPAETPAGQMELQAAVNAINDFWSMHPALRHTIPPS